MEDLDKYTPIELLALDELMERIRIEEILNALQQDAVIFIDKNYNNGRFNKI